MITVKTKAGNASVAATEAPTGNYGRCRANWPRQLWTAAIDLVFPPRCVACGCECEPSITASLFCSTCAAQLAPNDRPACLRCANVCSEVDLALGNCFHCRGRKLHFRAARAIGPYEGALRQ